MIKILLELIEKYSMISKLNLPLPELKILYTKHLILKELLINELSLYILSLCFLYRKQYAFNIYINCPREEKALPFLESLEDRFINGIVSYRIGFCYGQISKFYCNAYNIFKNQKQLSPEELFYMGSIYELGKGGVTKNNEKAIEFLKLSGDSNCPKACVKLGCVYRDGTIGIIRNYVTAVMYFEKATSLNLPAGKCHLAYMMEFGLGITKNSNRSKELYISAAKDNDEYSINLCKRMNWIL